MISINDFCDQHSACEEVRAWAIKNTTDMQHAWTKLNPDWLLWVATRAGILTDKELRLFAVFCARQVEHLLTDERSKNAIDVAESFANEEATKDELTAAWAAAFDAAREAARAAARADARDVARDVAFDAARNGQADWLRANTKPNFDEVTE